MKKNIKLFIGLALVVSLSLFLCKPSQVSADTNVLEPYLLKLQELNGELGVEYAIPFADADEQSAEFQEVANFYTAMSMEEFEDYIRIAYANDMQSQQYEESHGINVEKIDDHIFHTEFISSENLYSELTVNRISTDATALSASPVSVSQGYYYGGNNNSLWINTQTFNSGAGYVYLSVNTYGEYHYAYPYFDPAMGFSVSFSQNNSKANCNFNCVKYLSANLIASGYYNVSVTFTAGGGGVYGNII